MEHDPTDELLIRQAFLEANKNIKVFCLHDGDQVMNYLKYKNISAEFPRADIIMLNWNLPKKNGYAILKELKRDSNLQDIPIIIISAGAKCQEIIQSYKNFASGFICRKADEGFKKSIKGIIHYWSKIVILPPNLA